MRPVTNQPPNSTRFNEAIRRFDAENAGDPNQETMNGEARPRELVYAEWLTEWVLRLEPDASEELRLAARCQHLCRWKIRRDAYPMTRPGYLRWREDLRKFHAQHGAEILREIGYSEEVVARVANLNLKKGFPEDAETRVLEDALCLVFLQRQLAPLAAKSTEEKMINALQKSWKKMTPKAREIALGLEYPAKERALIEKALGE